MYLYKLPLVLITIVITILSLDLHSNVESFAKVIIFREALASPALFLLKNAPK